MYLLIKIYCIYVMYYIKVWWYILYTFSFVTLHATNSPKGENHKMNEARNVPPQNPG